MKILHASALAACLCIAACDSPPAILFTTNGADFDTMSLTDARGACEAPARVAYLSWWGQGAVQGCWKRERGDIVANFPDLPDQRIPAGEFRRTELAEYRGTTLPE
ncbi:hypothetical protein [Variovorax sp. KK3]|uniref:hypothetical protein n=1 Tax=Variovorax sp. KK3 TaxID=1855728 RepID=UPI00117E4949|nr:hypothetical protein [Variovorax sp. KK3]